MSSSGGSVPLKQQAAERALDFVQSEMIVGLGHGSTAEFAVRGLAERLTNQDIHSIRAIPCSVAVDRLARSLGIPITTLADHPSIDVTIDGADEVDSRMDLIKGGGGALLREKIVAVASQREIIVVDGSKLSQRLCTRFALPVEVVPFAEAVETRYLESIGATVSLRGGDQPFHTDQGNVILDCRFEPMDDPYELGRALDARPGIVGHGLFLGIATDLVVADDRGAHHFARGDDLSAVLAG